MIYDKIKKLSAQKKVTIRKIEVETGITLGSIYHWNEVNPSADKVLKVAKYLGVTVEEILEG